jgi:predicted GNAT family N-acyltransferase
VTFSVNAVDWQGASAALKEIRRRVFIDEQAVPESLEWDGLDEDAIHVLAGDSKGHPIGCGRLLPEGKIGRMAVLPEWRGKGVGRAILQTLLEIARGQDMDEVRLSAQVKAIPFYEKAGFTVCSEVYLDAGIPHRDMVLSMALSL